MSFLEIDGKRHSIPQGESTIGTGPDSFLQLAGAKIADRHLVIVGSADGQSVVRAVENAETHINGVRLGPQPTPLLHGDKIELGSCELLFVDERRSGSTQFVRAEDLAAYRPSAQKSSKAKATGATGGRLVSLTDGREYEIVGGAPLVIGRDATCDVVVTSKQVSRRHTEIVATPKGYVAVDVSTNGTFVNEERLQGEKLLARGDMLRVGSDEFRFYADVSKAPVPPLVESPVSDGPTANPDAPAGAAQRLNHTMHGVPAAVRPQAPPPSPPTPEPADAAIGAEQRLGNTMFGVPSPPRPTPPQSKAPPSPPPPPAPASRPSFLATLVGRSGGFKGTRFPIRVPVVNVGRAEYNDVVINDGTVSTIHAKMQHREGVWVLIDLESTNGTFVDGERIGTETPLAPGAIVRFGDVSTVFQPGGADATQEIGGSTRFMGAIKSPPSSSDEPKRKPPNPDSTDRSGFKLWPFK